MYSSVMSGCTQGLRTHLVKVEVDIQAGLPAFHIVGLPDASVKESKERIRSAFKNIGLSFPMKRVTVNLAPAHLRKEGSSFELAIAVALLIGENKLHQKKFPECLFLGELSLDGKINSIRGILPLVLSARRSGFKKVFIPQKNIQETSLVKDMSSYGIESLTELIPFLNGDKELKPHEASYEAKSVKEVLNFSQIKGQGAAKSALEIAAAGAHHMLMMGPPGCGKTLLAKSISSILPPLSFEESLETTQIYSVSGMLTEKNPFVGVRPFRDPHHTVSYAAMVGGGRVVLPGEVSLAHHGVLFLDEFPEFRKDVLESLREPLEQHQISIRRVSGTYQYPCNFLMVAALNPCPCGYFEHPKKECRCSPGQIEQYQAKISGPVLDRIDLHIKLSDIVPNDIEHFEALETSEERAERVLLAHEIQKNRFRNEAFKFNAHMTPSAIEKYCLLDDRTKQALNLAWEKFKFSFRTYHKILKISRTIADLQQKELIELPHLSYALQLRFLDR